MIKQGMLLAVITLLFTACTQKVTIKALNPAEVARMANNKNVAVTQFAWDTIGLGAKIETELANKIIDGKPFFKLVSRKHINKVIEEQRMAASGLISTKSSVSLGNITGANAIINGEISNADKQDSYYTEKRTKCRDKECTSTYTYNVSCVKRLISLGASINIVDTELGEVIYSNSYSPSNVYRKCRDTSNALPSKRQGLEKLARQVAKEFTQKLAPYYVYFKVALMEEVEFDISEHQAKRLEASLEFIKLKRYEKALEYLTTLNDELQGKSYAVLYDLAVVTEAMGKLKEAVDVYTLAEEAAMGPNELISNGITRVKSTIAKRDAALAQINK